MLLLYCEHCKEYTLKKKCNCGCTPRPAHPARFSPDDKFSAERVTLKRRHNLLLTQQPPQKY